MNYLVKFLFMVVLLFGVCLSGQAQDYLTRTNTGIYLYQNQTLKYGDLDSVLIGSDQSLGYLDLSINYKRKAKKYGLISGVCFGAGIGWTIAFVESKKKLDEAGLLEGIALSGPTFLLGFFAMASHAAGITFGTISISKNIRSGVFRDLAINHFNWEKQQDLLEKDETHIQLKVLPTGAGLVYQF